MSILSPDDKFKALACPVCGGFSGEHLSDHKGSCPVKERDDALRKCAENEYATLAKRTNQLEHLVGSIAELLRKDIGGGQ